MKTNFDETTKSSNEARLLLADASLESTIGPVNEDELIRVIHYLRGKETVRGAKLQIEFRKGYNWAFKVLDCLEKNGIVSSPDKYGDRKIIVEDDFFDLDFQVVKV